MPAQPDLSETLHLDEFSPHRAKDHFVNLTAHELRNPLRALALDAEYLARHLRDDGQGYAITDDVGDVATRMAVAARRMSEQVNDLLALQTGAGFSQATELVELGPLIQDILSGFEADLIEARATVAVHPMPTIKSNRPPLRMLFRNLIGNAIRYRHPDRPLRLDIMAKTHTLDDGRHLLQLTVSDNGLGIPRAEHHRVFEPYTRASDCREGIGLGLAICDRIVEHMGGSIHVESDGESGSTFVILIHSGFFPGHQRQPN